MRQSILVVTVLLLLCLGQTPGPPVRPDPHLTPGVALPVTAADVCVRGYAHRVRDVPEAVKRQVYAEYGIRSHAAGEYEIDHLISLELGGSNDIHNLWPERYDIRQNGTQVGAHTKDALEDALHAQVCAGKVTLQQAQQAIRTDWIAAYTRYVGALPPAR